MKILNNIAIFLDAVCALCWAFFLCASIADIFPPTVYRSGLIRASLVLTITFVFEFISDVDDRKGL